MDEVIAELIEFRKKHSKAMRRLIQLSRRRDLEFNFFWADVFFCRP